VTLRATPSAGYRFDHWQSTDVVVTAGGTFTMPAHVVAVQAVFATVGYAITYDLAGGTGAASNPTSYSVTSDDIVLAAPTRYAYAFTGWTGTGLASPTPTVTIAHGSTGDRRYTATWAPGAPAWSASTIYLFPGTTVFSEGRLYVNVWYSWGEKPGRSSTGSWAEVGAPTVTPTGTVSAWTSSWIYLGGEKVVADGKVYVAAWYSRGEKPGSPSGSWEEQGAPVVTARGTYASWTASWIYSGGETVASGGHLWKAKYYSRNSAPSARNGAWQDLGAY
jgi:uncharacterized repeat protein (TIGR02543 family)